MPPKKPQKPKKRSSSASYSYYSEDELEVPESNAQKRDTGLKNAMREWAKKGGKSDSKESLQAEKQEAGTTAKKVAQNDGQVAEKRQAPKSATKEAPEKKKAPGSAARQAAEKKKAPSSAGNEAAEKRKAPSSAGNEAEKKPAKKKKVVNETESRSKESSGVAAEAPAQESGNDLDELKTMLAERRQELEEEVDVDRKKDIEKDIDILKQWLKEKEKEKEKNKEKSSEREQEKEKGQNNGKDREEKDKEHSKVKEREKDAEKREKDDKNALSGAADAQSAKSTSATKAGKQASLDPVLKNGEAVEGVIAGLRQALEAKQQKEQEGQKAVLAAPEVQQVPPAALSSDVTTLLPTEKAPPCELPLWCVMPNLRDVETVFEIVRLVSGSTVPAKRLRLGRRAWALLGRRLQAEQALEAKRAGIPPPDIGLASPLASKSHALVLQNWLGQIFLLDLGSGHGTFVGGVRLKPREPCEWKPGVQVVFAEPKLEVFELRASSGSA